MIKTLGSSGDTLVVGLHITDENIKRLLAGMPIKVKLQEMGVPYDIDVYIHHGKDEDVLLKQLTDAGLIGPTTKVNKFYEDDEE